MGGGAGAPWVEPRFLRQLLRNLDRLLACCPAGGPRAVRVVGGPALAEAIDEPAGPTRMGERHDSLAARLVGEADPSQRVSARAGEQSAHGVHQRAFLAGRHQLLVAQADDAHGALGALEVMQEGPFLGDVADEALEERSLVARADAAVQHQRALRPVRARDAELEVLHLAVRGEEGPQAPLVVRVRVQPDAVRDGGLQGGGRREARHRGERLVGKHDVAVHRGAEDPGGRAFHDLGVAQPEGIVLPLEGGRLPDGQALAQEGQQDQEGGGGKPDRIGVPLGGLDGHERNDRQGDGDDRKDLADAPRVGDRGHVRAWRGGPGCASKDQEREHPARVGGVPRDVGALEHPGRPSEVRDEEAPERRVGQGKA